MTHRPANITQHLILLGIGIAVPLLGAMLVVDGERIAFAFAPDWQFPHLCSSRVLFDVQCPGCGLTRSIVHLMHGDVAESFAVHHLGGLVLALIVLQIPWQVWRLKGGEVPFRLSGWAICLLWCGVAGLMLVDFLWTRWPDF